MQIAQWLVAALGVYVAAGLLFGAAFVLRGIDFVDSAAHGAGAGFRLLVLPGAAALWPVLLRKWLEARR